MKTNLLRIAILSILIAAYVSVDAQVTQRPRVATPSPSPTATPAPTQTPTPAVVVQTLDQLQTRIRQRLFSMDVRRGRVGVKIVSLNTGKVVFEQDSEKYFMPASNMKNFTVAAGFERLGPDFRFVTSVFANALPDADGAVKGDLRVFGRGDVSMSTAFFGSSANDPETYYRAIDRLAERIAAAGVKRIEGSIVGDESYFSGFAIPMGWEWDDLQWYYGAEVSALPINDNAVDLSVRPGTVGGPCIVTISPPNSLFQVLNTCVTTSSNGRTVDVHKRIHQNVLEISGTIAAGNGGHTSTITISRPGELFVALLKQRLEKRGVVVTGGSRLLPGNTAVTAPQIEIAKLESPPYREIAAKTMKPSQNMYTETILWTLGEQSRSQKASGADSSVLGLGAVRSVLKQMGIDEDAVVQYDGSGLSRHNLVTPSAVVELYRHMAKQSRNAIDWRNSLTVGGVDGTLRNRFKGTAASGNMRGKTGTLDQVSALSGYVTTAAGEELVVSIIVNGVPTLAHRTSLADDIVVYLANFNGRID